MTTETSIRINYERAKLVIGISLLAIGLIISRVTWDDIYSYQGGVTQIVNVSPAPNYPFWKPLEWVVLKVPDYLLQHLVMGALFASVGVTILAFTIWKRLAGIEDD